MKRHQAFWSFTFLVICASVWGTSGLGAISASAIGASNIASPTGQSVPNYYYSNISATKVTPAAPGSFEYFVDAAGGPCSTKVNAACHVSTDRNGTSLRYL